MPYLLFFVLFVAGCSQQDVPAAAAAGDSEIGAVLEEQQVATTSDLAGTAWQLDRILFMDDRVVVPDESSKYTISFAADGRAAIRADCNRGSGSWTADGAGLAFGPLAMTRAMCPPDSLHNTFIAQLDYVRSFVLEDGNLHLATMADGSILQFEPLTE